uniref:Uncharacterized protein n=1 Tax=Lotharella oceanica TaxID=641309 RepID=A0A7S2U398_9EUKA|mmetsp:Transcript_6551/g.12975  ORF Transcript_6551/g.12975 Transcript_6551/m.12975 type:complete len:111 (+) Transcript_6551:24-356(+)
MCDQPPDEEELCAYMRLRELRVDKTASPAKSKPENKRRKERNEKQSRYRGTFDRNKISAFLKKLFQAGGKGVTGIIGSYLPPTCEVRYHLKHNVCRPAIITRVYDEEHMH